MGNRDYRRRRNAKKKRRALIAPALVRPERVEIDRRADEFELACARQNSVNRAVATVILGGLGAGLVAAFLAALGVF